MVIFKKLVENNNLGWNFGQHLWVFLMGKFLILNWKIFNEASLKKCKCDKVKEKGKEMKKIVMKRREMAGSFL